MSPTINGFGPLTAHHHPEWDLTLLTTPSAIEHWRPLNPKGLSNGVWYGVGLTERVPTPYRQWVLRYQVSKKALYEMQRRTRGKVTDDIKALRWREGYAYPGDSGGPVCTIGCKTIGGIMQMREEFLGFPMAVGILDGAAICPNLTEREGLLTWKSEANDGDR